MTGRATMPGVPAGASRATPAPAVATMPGAPTGTVHTGSARERGRTYNAPRRERAHRRGCRALGAVERGDYPAPWSPIPERSYFGTRAAAEGARRDGRHVWIEFRCNDTHCPARLHVDGMWVVDHAERPGGAP